MTNLTISQKLKNRTLVGYELIDPYQEPDYNQTSGSTVEIIDDQYKITINEKAEKIYQEYYLPEEYNVTEDFDILQTKDIFDELTSNLNEISNQAIKEFSKLIFNLIIKIVSPYLIMNLPTPYSFIRDDGSFLFEWPFSHYKIGFSIETKINESSWYFISDEKFGYFNALGDLNNENLESILNWLIPFIIKNKDN